MSLLKKVRRCCVPSCNNDSKSNPHLIYFGFPKDGKRTKEWVLKINRPDLMDKDTSTLHNNYKICNEHFDPKLYEKSRLKTYAMPTIFNKPGKSKRQTRSSIRESSWEPSANLESPQPVSNGTSDMPLVNSPQEAASTPQTAASTPQNSASTLVDTNGVKLPVYLHVGSNQINAKLQKKIKKLIGSNNKTDGPIVTNITAEQFKQICDILSTENIMQ